MSSPVFKLDGFSMMKPEHGNLKHPFSHIRVLLLENISANAREQLADQGFQVRSSIPHDFLPRFNILLMYYWWWRERRTRRKFRLDAASSHASSHHHLTLRLRSPPAPSAHFCVNLAFCV